MKGTIYSNDNYCAMIGTWDPPIIEFKEMIFELIEYCNSNQLCPLIILINPNPSIFYAEKYYRDYLDVFARIEFLNMLGVRHYLIMEFRKEDIKASAKVFFDELNLATVIKELWLGGLQSFGTGDQGSQKEIVNQCSLRNIKVKILEKTLKVKIARSSVYKHFVNFDFQKTKEITGFFPTFNKDLTQTLNFFDGKYWVLNAQTPFKNGDHLKRVITILNGKIQQKSELLFPWIIILEKKL